MMVAKPVIETVNATELGRVLGISRASISNLGSEGVLPHAGRGLYDLASAVQAYIRHRLLQAGAADVGTKSLVAERSRLAKLKADAAERDARVEAGELVDVKDVETAWLSVVNAAYARLLTIPSKVSPRVITFKTAAEAQALLQKELYAALSGLAAGPPAL
jgi:phage terminase Nu1 subunit (DNA packaging protein)